jgi:hypothetical protein
VSPEHVAFRNVLTVRQLQILQHCLGWSWNNNAANRNHFCSAPVDLEDCKALESRGLFYVCNSPSCGFETFHATVTGASVCATLSALVRTKERKAKK